MSSWYPGHVPFHPNPRILIPPPFEPISSPSLMMTTSSCPPSLRSQSTSAAPIQPGSRPRSRHWTVLTSACRAVAAHMASCWRRRVPTLGEQGLAAVVRLLRSTSLQCRHLYMPGTCAAHCQIRGRMPVLSHDSMPVLRLTHAYLTLTNNLTLCSQSQPEMFEVPDVQMPDFPGLDWQEYGGEACVDPTPENAPQVGPAKGMLAQGKQRRVRKRAATVDNPCDIQISVQVCRPFRFLSQVL